MKIKQKEQKKKTPKRKKKQQQQKRPSRSFQRKSGQKQSYKVHMLDGQAKDIRIKDLEAELAATKTKLSVERHGKLEALAGLDSCKKERDKSDALASKLVAKKVPGSWNA